MSKILLERNNRFICLNFFLKLLCHRSDLILCHNYWYVIIIVVIKDYNNLKFVKKNVRMERSIHNKCYHQIFTYLWYNIQNAHMIEWQEYNI